MVLCEANSARWPLRFGHQAIPVCNAVTWIDPPVDVSVARHAAIGQVEIEPTNETELAAGPPTWLAPSTVNVEEGKVEEGSCSVTSIPHWLEREDAVTCHAICIGELPYQLVNCHGVEPDELNVMNRGCN
jgi:hypothetical protein